eukprot:96184_1
MALSKYVKVHLVPSSLATLHQPYSHHKRHFAKAKQKEKSQSTLSQLKADKTTQQYAEILSWWNQTKKARLDLLSLSPELREDFIRKRETYKRLNIARINKMKHNIAIAAQRKQEALNALPSRLSFICKISKEPKWKSDLPSTVQNAYFNLHHTAKTTPSVVSSLHLDDNQYYDINKLRHKEKHQIETLEKERLSTMKPYTFPTYPLEHFPAAYDPNDIQTQPAYVRSYFDYIWKPGMDVPVKDRKPSMDPDAHLSDEEKQQVYGHDYSGVQLSKIVQVESAGGSGIGGTEDLKKKLEAEEEASLTAQQKLERERGKKTAEARAKHNLMMEKKRQAKEKIKQSVKDWETTLKKRDKKKENKDEDSDDEAVDERREDALKRIEELEIVDKDLPRMEALLVDKELNKEFFEKTLPILLNHELVDDDKRQECVLLVRKYHTLQKHVGYGVR